MKRRSVLKSLAAMPIIVSAGRLLSYINPVKRRTLGKIAISEKPSTILLDSNFPEAHIDLHTGELYIKVDDKELVNKEFFPTFEEHLNMETFWMSAKQDGECSECEDYIQQGDRVVYDNETFKTYCTDCGEEVAGLDPLNRSYLK